MTDYFTPMPPDQLGALLEEQARRAKPNSQMTPAEWAEWQVLEAIQAAETAKVRLMFVRVTGRAPSEIY